MGGKKRKKARGDKNNRGAKVGQLFVKRNKEKKGRRRRTEKNPLWRQRRLCSLHSQECGWSTNVLCVLCPLLNCLLASQQVEPPACLPAAVGSGSGSGPGSGPLGLRLLKSSCILSSRRPAVVLAGGLDPTDPLTILEPRNLSSNQLYLARKRRSADFDAPKVCKGRSGATTR